MQTLTLAMRGLALAIFMESEDRAKSGAGGIHSAGLLNRKPALTQAEAMPVFRSARCRGRCGELDGVGEKVDLAFFKTASVIAEAFLEAA